MNVDFFGQDFMPAPREANFASREEYLKALDVYTQWRKQKIEEQKKAGTYVDPFKADPRTASYIQHIKQESQRKNLINWAIGIGTAIAALTLFQ